MRESVLTGSRIYYNNVFVAQSRGCYQETSVPQHTGLSVGLPECARNTATQQPASPRAGGLKERETEKPEGSEPFKP